MTLQNYNVYCDSKLLGERTNTNPELSVLRLHSFTHEPLIKIIFTTVRG